MRAVIQAAVRPGGPGADSGAIGGDDNAAGRRLGADPRCRRSTGHARVRAAQVHCRASRGGGRHMAEKASRELADVVAASTALSDIDGSAGRLYYRGYDINQLAGV